MTRHQRRREAAKRSEERTLRLATAARDARNQSIIAANVGALRNGVRFETSGALAPKAYSYQGASSEAARVGSNIAGTKEVSMNDKQTAKFVSKTRNQLLA